MNRASLFDLSGFSHKICGMHVNCAEFIRNNRKEEINLQRFVEEVIKNVGSDVKVGVWIGPAIGNSWAQNESISNQPESCDVIMAFLSDITNIDSKQVTFISDNLSSDVKTRIWDNFYKKDFTNGI